MNQDDKNEPQKNAIGTSKSATGKPVNPFENDQSAEKDIAQSKEEIENEQQFKEAQTERD